MLAISLLSATLDLRNTDLWMTPHRRFRVRSAVRKLLIHADRFIPRSFSSVRSILPKVFGCRWKASISSGRSPPDHRTPFSISPPTANARMNTDPHQQFPQAAFAGLMTGETSQQASDAQFDIFEWYPRYQSCQRYFLDYAQHSMPVQALASFLNIRLPMHRMPNPTFNYSNSAPPASGSVGPDRNPASRINSTTLPPLNQLQADPCVSLIPYLRRLVATGMDFPGVLHGFFGDDWAVGVGPLHDQERRNYLFAAKSGGWASVKRDYDMPPLETVPFLRPLQGPADAEIEAAERCWSEWLAMEDWMVGPRAPDIMENDPSSQTTRSRASRQGS